MPPSARRPFPAQAGDSGPACTRGEVFVVSHDPKSWPHCWAIIEGKDLGGAALFVGMNDAVVVRGRGVRWNSVHYWDITGKR
jgi:hypothetical protein